jgi:hypothetical protein
MPSISAHYVPSILPTHNPNPAHSKKIPDPYIFQLHHHFPQLPSIQHNPVSQSHNPTTSHFRLFAAFPAICSQWRPQVSSFPCTRARITLTLHIDTPADAQPAAVAPLSNPPPGHKLLTYQYDSYDALQEDLDDFCASAGFAVVIARSQNKVKGFGYTRFDLVCSKGKGRKPRGHSRHSSTTKRGCEWQGIAKALLGVDGVTRKWRFEVRQGCESHNDHDAQDQSTVPQKFTPEQVAFVSQYIDRPLIPNREIGRDLRLRFPNLVFEDRQISNLRYRLKQQSLAGYTPFQATKKLLDDEGIYHTVKWAEVEGEERKPEGLFWSFDWCKKLWSQNDWIQMYDNTYKTNNKGLALFQVVGLTNANMAFSCAFGLINTERQEGFGWLMEQVDSLRGEIHARPPKVTITDYDKAIRNAIAVVYPDAQPQLCIFHVNKNVALNIKKKWDKRVAAEVATQTQAQPQQAGDAQQEAGDDDQQAGDSVERMIHRVLPRGGNAERTSDTDAVEYSRAGIYKLWFHMVYAATLDDFNAAWEKLKAYFGNQADIITYLEEVWIPVVEQWAGCYLNRRLNFGQRTTSPVESVNRYLKSFVVTGNSTVLDVVKQSLEMVKAMERNITQVNEKQRHRIRIDFATKEWMGKARYAVCQTALDFVNQQHQKMLYAITTPSRPGEPLPPCIHTFTTQMGIPCSHELLRRYRADKAFTLEKADFHPF